MAKENEKKALKPLKNDLVFCTIKWTVEDLKAAMRNHGIKDTDENVRVILADKNGFAKGLEEGCVSEGWNIMNVLLDDFTQLSRRYNPVRFGRVSDGLLSSHTYITPDADFAAHLMDMPRIDPARIILPRTDMAAILNATFDIPTQPDEEPHDETE